MRILWSSNGPWVPSGYGQQSKLFFERLSADHEMHGHWWYGLQGGLLQMGEHRAYPMGFAPYGQDVLAQHAKHANADIVITLIDAWIYSPEQLQGFRWCPWFPVDTEPISPRIVERMRVAYQPIVFSRHAERECEREGINTLYVPHGADCNVMCPGDREAARKAMGLPLDKFIVLAVAANKDNPSRKSWPEMLDAFAAFHAKHPDSVFYCHTMPGGGTDLIAKCKALGLDPGTVLFTATYPMLLGLNDQWMANLYRSADVFLNPAAGEGFGVPILEAQACGCPVIVGEWTAMGELCFGGWAIPRDEAFKWWIGGPGGQAAYDTYMYRPHAEAITKRLEEAYDALHDPEEATILRGKAREGALAYDADLVYRDYWVPALKRIEERIGIGAGELRLVKV